MNTPGPLSIDVLSDVVCPWCYIGKRRLEAAIEGREGAAPVVLWHPFQLNPDVPAGGLDRRAYLEEKFGGPERAREIYANVTAAGRDAGIDFDFERIARQPNTLDAHRLIGWAQSVDTRLASGLVERVFAAYFTEGVDVGDAQELARIAGEAGYDAEAAAAMLASDAGREEVAAANAQAQRLGIGGVPFFIFNRRLAVSGAHPPEVLRDAMAQAESGAEDA
jgi:predicted DsbA family dithiol-disulfide isomerase